MKSKPILKKDQVRVTLESKIIYVKVCDERSMGSYNYPQGNIYKYWLYIKLINGYYFNTTPKIDMWEYGIRQNNGQAIAISTNISGCENPDPDFLTITPVEVWEDINYNCIHREQRVISKWKKGDKIKIKGTAGEGKRLKRVKLINT